MKIVQLGELVSIQTGKLDANASSLDGAYPFFTCSREPLKIAAWKYDLDAILIAGNGDLNIKHYKGKFDAYQRTYILSSKNNNVDTRYLYYFLDKYLDRLREQSIGGIIKYIKLGMLTDAPIPLPLLAEQKRIAAILDHADDLRRKRQRALTRLGQLGQAIFYEMFSNNGEKRNWPIADLLDFSDIQVGFPFKSTNYREDGKLVRLCRGANVFPNRIDWSDLACLPDEFAKTHFDFLLQEGDIVIAMDRPWISSGFKVSRIENYDLPCLLVQRVARIRAKNRVDEAFLNFLVRSSDFQMACRTTETTVPHISPTDIRRFKFPCPPEIHRKAFGDNIVKIRAALSNTITSKALIENLFLSIQHRAFNGEL